MSQRITLQTSLGASGAGLKDVSLLTTGIEAEGHGIYLDEKTAEGAMKRLLGRSVKSYLRHEGAGGDRLGQEIGFFSGIYRAGAQIKASAFEFLESFKKEAGATAERLLEMAAKLPDQFGISVVAEYRPVWVMSDGTEMAARLGETAPEGAVRARPSMRILDIISADFVGRPAANPAGLFSKPDAPAKPVDAAASQQPATPAISMSQAPAASAAPVTPPAPTPEPAAVVTTLSIADHEAKLAELATGHTAAMTAKDGEIAALKAEKDALTAALAAKETEHKAALEKAVAEAIAPVQAKLTEAEKYDARKLGVPPVHIAQSAAPVAPTTPAAKLEHYEKLEGAERSAFRKAHYADLIAAENARAK